MAEFSFEGVEVPLQRGDLLKSKLGWLCRSSLTDSDYLVFEAKYLGKGKWLSVRKKELDKAKVV